MLGPAFGNEGLISLPQDSVVETQCSPAQRDEGGLDDDLLIILGGLEIAA